MGRGFGSVPFPLQLSSCVYVENIYTGHIPLTTKSKGKKMTTVTVTWNTEIPNTPDHKAYYENLFATTDKKASVESQQVEVFGFESADEVLNAVYRDTNLYSGQVWDALQPMPEERMHTALSMGDFVTVDGVKFVVAEFGFEKVGG